MIIKVNILAYLSAIVKVVFQIAFAIVSAIPFRIAWNGVIPEYFAQYIPENLHYIPYWKFVGIILVITFIGEQLRKLVPITKEK